MKQAASIRDLTLPMVLPGITVSTTSSPRNVERRSLRPGLPRGQAGFRPTPHMLRHACGYALANRGHDTQSAARARMLRGVARRGLLCVMANLMGVLGFS